MTAFWVVPWAACAVLARPGVNNNWVLFTARTEWSRYESKYHVCVTGFTGYNPGPSIHGPFAPSRVHEALKSRIPAFGKYCRQHSPFVT